MNDQTPIRQGEARDEKPRDKAQPSLLERASARFGFDGFASPKLPDIPVPDKRRAPARPAAAPAASASDEAPATKDDAPRNERAPIGPPLVFSGKPQALDRDLLHETGMIVPDGSVSALLEEFRIVKRELFAKSTMLRGSDDPRLRNKANRVLISSPLPGEGKTYCATNLALAIAAEKESEVLLVDADFAKPSVLSTLGLEGGPGLMDALVDRDMNIADCVIPTDVPGLNVLPAGRSTGSDTEYLTTRHARETIESLGRGAAQRIVIFDSPPALAASPAAELAKLVGQTLVVCRADTTGRSALEDTVSLLSGCKDIELLLNAVQFSPSGRRFGSYYGYEV
ncbi:MAG: capsular biosynthesis protein [Sphingomonadales bacterium CG12_big_fil_rev_8_21_14_0_65_65_10]|nr:MAG: capsular biosynthesis protein [Sphingomonadales bacterium CG12_big_fil_rev_8_21_14_0_65_65_10]